MNFDDALRSLSQFPGNDTLTHGRVIPLIPSGCLRARRIEAPHAPPDGPSRWEALWYDSRGQLIARYDLG